MFVKKKKSKGLVSPVLIFKYATISGKVGLKIFYWISECRSTFIICTDTERWWWYHTLASLFFFFFSITKKFIVPGQINPCRTLQVSQDAGHKVIKIQVYWISVYIKYGSRWMIWPCIQESLTTSELCVYFQSNRWYDFYFEMILKDIKLILSISNSWFRVFVF